MANDTPELNDNAEQALFWFGLANGAIALLTGGIIVLFCRWIRVRLAALRLFTKRGKRVAVPDGEFVVRKEKKEELLEALADEYYTTVFVYGRKGSGKSSLIRHALENRRAVFEIDISEKDSDEAARAEFVAEMSKELDTFLSTQDRTFVKSVFAASWVEPVVVVSVEAKCSGEVLQGLLSLCKIVTYEEFGQQITARIVVNLSGSRATIDTSINIHDMRCVGVHVGNFEESEALTYALDRMPSFKDEMRRAQLAKEVIQKFDPRVLTLQRVCKQIRKAVPDHLQADLNDVRKIIKKEWESEVKKARSGWTEFCFKLSETLEDDFEAAKVEMVATLLQQGPQDINKIVSVLLKGTKKVLLSPRLIGLFNADAGAHPLDIDPFETTVSLSGKAIAAALSEKKD